MARYLLNSFLPSESFILSCFCLFLTHSPVFVFLFFLFCLVTSNPLCCTKATELEHVQDTEYPPICPQVNCKGSCPLVTTSHGSSSSLSFPGPWLWWSPLLLCVHVMFRVLKLFSLHHPLLVYSVSLTKHPSTLANLNCTSLWYSSNCCCYLPSHGPLPSVGSHQCFPAGISENTQWQERIHPTTWNRCSSHMSSRCWMLGLLQIEPGFPTKEKKKGKG